MATFTDPSRSPPRSLAAQRPDRVGGRGTARRRCGLLIATLVFGSGSDATLAEAPKGGAGTVRPTDKERLREQIFDQMRAERMWKLTDALKLDEAMAARVFPLLSKYDDHERNLVRERGEAFRALRQAIEAPTPDPARMEPLVDRLIALRARRQALETEKITALRKVLTPLQMAKMMLLAPRLDEGFRQRIREVIDGHPDEPGHEEPGRGKDRRGPGRAAPPPATP
jgi:Spy/CpxP family protein refolding chaperone